MENCCNPQYKILRNLNVMIRIDTLADNCCRLTDGSIVEVHNIAHHKDVNRDVIIGKEFCCTEDLYNTPCPSSLIGIYVISKLSELKTWTVDDIEMKYVKLLLSNNKFAAFPLLHQ